VILGFRPSSWRRIFYWLPFTPPSPVALSVLHLKRQAKHHEGDVLLCRGPLDSDWMILFFGDVAQPGRENRSLLGLVKIPISNTKYGDQKYHKNIHKHEYTCYSHLNYPS